MNLKKSVFILIIIAILSKGIGFLKDLIIANKYGASMYTDAFISAPIIPISIIAGFFSVLSVGLIPFLQKKRHDKFNDYINQIFWSYLLLGILAVVLYWFSAPLLIKLFYPGYSRETLALTIQYSRIISLSLLFLSTLYVVQSFLEFYEEFIKQNIISFFTTSFMVFICYLTFPNDVKYLAYLIWIIVISYFFNWSIQVYLVNSKISIGRLDKRNLFRSEYKTLFNLSIPVFLGNMIDQINSMVDKALASTLLEGTISSMHYSSKISGVISSLIPLTIAKVYFPKISGLIVNKEYKKLESMLNKIFNVSLVIIVTFIVIISMNTDLITEYVFSNLNAYNKEVLKFTLSVYLVNVIFITINIFLIKIFIAIGNTRIITIGAVISLCINICLNFITFSNWGYKGLVISTGVSLLILNLYYLYKLFKHTSINFIYKLPLQYLFLSMLFYLLYSCIDSTLSFKNHIIDAVITSLIFMIVVSLSYFILKNLRKG